MLVLRFIDEDHANKYPLQLRIRGAKKTARGGQLPSAEDEVKKRYKMAGFLLGQRKCGHQVGVACSGKGWRNWIIVDADAATKGIGPMHIHFLPGTEAGWWKAWQSVVSVTKYGSGEFCPLSPWNVDNNAYDHFRGGTNCVDAVYVYDGE